MRRNGMLSDRPSLEPAFEVLWVSKGWRGGNMSRFFATKLDI